MKKIFSKISLKIGLAASAALVMSLLVFPRQSNVILADYYFDGCGPTYDYYYGYDNYPYGSYTMSNSCYGNSGTSYGYNNPTSYYYNSSAYDSNYAYNYYYPSGHTSYGYQHNKGYTGGTAGQYGYYYQSGGTGQIWHQAPARLGQLCMYSSKIHWNTSSVKTAYITVRDPDTGAEKVFASGASGSQDAPWIAPNKNYRFTLWNMDNKGQQQLAQTWVYVGGSCHATSYHHSPKGGSMYNPPTYSPPPGSGQPPAGQPSAISISAMDDFFSPASITVRAGTTVTWTNSGVRPHTVTADNSSFDSGTMNSGATYSQTFNTPGTYRYYCRFHGAPGGAGMSGTITVTN